MTPNNTQFGFVSPPPNYQHTRSSSFSSFQFIVSSDSSPQDDEHYLVKYKDMKQKVKELELDNDRLHVKCLSVRKNIQRLRLERAILYERLQALNLNGNTVSQNNVTPHVATTPTREEPKPLQLNQSQIPSETTQWERPVLKQNVTTTTTSTSSFPEIRNGNYIKTFPFVHEYSTMQPHRGRHQAQRRRRRHQHQQAQETIPSTIPLEYPVEIKFHQYEGGPGQRSRREIDFVDEGGKQSRQLQQASEEKEKESNARKIHVATFRDQFIYSFQVHPPPPPSMP